MILDDLETHRETCRVCRPWSCCPVAARLLEQVTQQAAAQIAPAPKPRGEA